MRYYNIVISDADGSNVVQPASLQGALPGSTYTSFLNGQTLPGAMNVELNVPVTVFHMPLGAAFVRVWGISLAEIGQATNLRGKTIKVYAGMQKGLPLAKPEQAGLILSGVITQSFGNWIDTAMTLDLITAYGTGTVDEPKNIIHDWKKGTKLSDAIDKTLTTAFPGYKVDLNISGDLVLGEDDKGYSGTIEQYASYVNGLSHDINKDPNYQGVSITLKDKTFKVYDGTTQGSPIQIAFEDMIGQPTWLDPLVVQFKTAMRADIGIGDVVKFPPAVFTQTQSGAPFLGSGLDANSIFQGTFLVNQITHFGNFRQPDAASWNTTFNVVSTLPDATVAGAG